MYVANFKMNDIQYFVCIPEKDTIPVAVKEAQRATKTLTRAGALELIEYAKPHFPDTAVWPETKEDVLVALCSDDRECVGVSSGYRPFYNTPVLEWSVKPQEPTPPAQEDDAPEPDAEEV